MMFCHTDLLTSPFVITANPIITISVLSKCMNNISFFFTLCIPLRNASTFYFLYFNVIVSQQLLWIHILQTALHVLEFVSYMEMKDIQKAY